ncbi:MAG: hypothetical protein J0I08_02355 [Rhizobiales bacterium]|nr:hypothetical protein [Hyphomicrobiales bacterium]
MKSPDGTARAGVKKRTVKKTTKKTTAKKAAVKKVVVRKAASVAKVVKTVAKTSTTTSTKTSTKAGAAMTVAERKATVAKTQRLVDETPLVVDDGDQVAKTKIAMLREAKAKARAPDHQGRARRSAVERVNDPPPAAGQALIARVSRAIERELTQIEAIVGGHYVAPRQRTEAERRARTLASLARTLREVTTLRLSEKKEKREDDDAVPRDLGELRLALARRLDQLVADAKTAHPDAVE